MATYKSLRNYYGPDSTAGINTNKENIALLSFKMATTDSLTKFNLKDGFVDDYNDNSGVDAANSTNEIRGTYNGYQGLTEVTTTGGDANTTDGDYSVLKFTTTGSGATFTVDQAIDVDYIIAAGGGGGAGHSGNDYGGGGGGGGVRSGTFTATANGTYNITVGVGGTGQSGTSQPGGDGGDSAFTGPGISAINATGGGGGGWRGDGPGQPGGSGGGGGSGTSPGGYVSTPGGSGNDGSYTPAEGYPGSPGASGDPGYAGGGGGGSAEAAPSHPNTSGGAGGDGILSQIVETGVNAYYGGGGGGASTGGPGGGGAGGGGRGAWPGGAQIAGGANTGGGGGGAAASNTDNSALSAGGSGVVILRLETAGIPSNLTLQSEAFTAQAAPETARIILDEADFVGTTTLDTDIKAYASRDNGTTFTQLPLVLQEADIATNQGGIDTYTKLMLHMDGTNNGTTFTDSSTATHGVTITGGVVTQTGTRKMGTASAYFPGDDDNLVVADTTDFALGASNCTFDYWIRFTDITTNSINMVFDRTASGNGYQWYWTPNQWRLWANGLTNTYVTGSHTPVINTWYHIALVKTGTAYKVFVDGVDVSTGNTGSGNWTDATSGTSLKIGQDIANSGREIFGNIDEFRISNTARWSTAFTPNSIPYSSGTYFTRRLLSGTADISGQPSGTAMKYKITTHNQATAKQTRLYGTSMAWS